VSPAFSYCRSRYVQPCSTVNDLAAHEGEPLLRRLSGTIPVAGAHAMTFPRDEVIFLIGLLLAALVAYLFWVAL
jgi:hypothetical protein